MLNISDAQIIALPVDELGLIVLADIDLTGQWNELNYTTTAASQQHPHSPVAVSALAEALGWLRARGLIARSPGQNTSDAIFVTRAGRAALKDGIGAVRVGERLQTALHPDLERPVRRQFMLGEYGVAVFVAMRQAEIRLRGMAGESDSVVAAKLARSVFGKDGALADPAMDVGEHVARMELFAGALGFFKNPTSHREVDYSDPIEAEEVILLADLLMRILDRIEAD